MTFDPDKHQFGMAYEDKSNLLFYPLYEENPKGRWGKQSGKWYGYFNNICCVFIRKEELTRSPEHDLIPRSAVDVLVKALKPLARVYEVSGVKETSIADKMGIWSCSDNRTENNTSHTLTLGDCKRAQEALKTFSEMVGE